MKLYELKRGQKFRLEEDVQAPPDIGFYRSTREFTLHHIDGMYSLCSDEFGRNAYPAAWAEVSVLEETK